MKKEVSAGGVIVRSQKSSWQVLLVRDMNGSYTFPKGKVEKGESLIAAALREVSEEVGLHGLTELKKLPELNYVYRRSGLVDKTVHYYILRYDGSEIPVAQKEEGLKDAQWFSLSEADGILGYPDSNKPLLSDTASFLKTL
jgi:8-oxo-dGTP pyrophosphatase MutT (NUDIX family)